MNYLLFIVSIICLTALINAEKISSLPGYKGRALNQDSGYIDIDPSHGNNIFYWHIEALEKPETKPLIVWYQGGPGCSGLYGLFTENGPFRLQRDGSVDFFDVTWLNFANMIWVESPVGVGFSYSNDPNDYTTNDNITAEGNYKFLVQAITKEFPQYINRDLYLTGESYGGVYIPTLSYLIASNPKSPIFAQFKGITNGNPVMNCAYSDKNGRALEFNLFYWHGIVSYTNYKNWTKNDCDKSDFTKICGDIWNTVLKQAGKIVQQKRAEDFPSIDPDDLFQDFCTGNGTLEYSLHKDNKQCEPYGNLLTTYLNRDDVQTAIHAKKTNWASCSSSINYQAFGYNMVNYYNYILSKKPGFKLLIYSGDVDIMTVPFALTKPCVAEINSGSLKSDWQPWFVNGATAGYVEEYQNYVYSTLKGAGHESPAYQPLNAYEMQKRFIETGSLKSEQNWEKMKKLANQRSEAQSQGNMLRKYGLSMF